MSPIFVLGSFTGLIVHAEAMCAFYKNTIKLLYMRVLRSESRNTKSSHNMKRSVHSFIKRITLLDFCQNPGVAWNGKLILCSNFHKNLNLSTSLS